MEKMPWDDVPAIEESSSKMPWDDVPAEVPMDTPTAEELQKYSEPDPARASLVTKPRELQNAEGFTEEEANTIPQGDMDVSQTIQANRDQSINDQYKDYQSGNVIVKNGVQDLRREDMGDNFEVTTDMYEKSQNPDKLYELAQKQADGTTFLGEPTIKGRRVPKPGEYDWFGAPTEPLALSPFKKQNSLVMDAAREGTKNALVTGAAVLDELGVTDWFSEWVNRSIADPPKAKNAVDSFIKDAVKTSAATVAGSKVGFKGSQPVTGDRIAQVVAALGGAVAGVSVMNTDDPTLVTGDKALFKLLEGSKNEDGSFSGEVVSSKLNQLQEAFMLAYPTAKAAEVGLWLSGFINNAVIKPVEYGMPTVRGSRLRAEKVTKDILVHLSPDSKIDGSNIDDLVRYLRENKEEVFNLGDSKIPDGVIERTPMSAINEGALKEGDHLLANKALELEKGGLESGISRLITRREQPIRELDSLLQNAADSRGGKNTIEHSRKLLADQAIDRLNVADDTMKTAKIKHDTDILTAKNTLDDKLTQTEMEASGKVDASQGLLDEVNTELDNLYKTDETFARTLDDLSKDSGIEVANKFRIGETKKLLPEIVNSVKALKDKKNALYDAIPEGATIDVDSFTDSVAPLVENKWLPKEIEKLISDRLVDNDSLDAVDFRFVYKDILPKVNAQISKEINLGPNMNPDRLAALEGLRDNISITQMEVLMKSPDKEVAESAKAARDFFKGTYLKYAKDHKTPVGQLFDAYDEAWNDHLGTIDQGDITSLKDNYSVIDKAQNVIEKGVTDERLGSSQQIIDFMRNPDYKGDSKGLIKVYKGEVAGAIADQLMGGKSLQDIDPALVYKTLKDKGVVLKENFPEEVAEINSFIQRFKSAKMNQKQAQEALDLAKKEGADAVKLVRDQNKTLLSEVKDTAKASLEETKDTVKVMRKQVKKSALDKFVEIGPDGPLEKPNGYNVFKTMLTRAGNENKIKDIARRVQQSGDKEAQKGLESAYFTFMQKFYKSGSNAKRINPTSATKLSDDNESIKKYGEIIFGNHTNPKDKETSLNTLKVYNKFLDGVFNEQTKVSDTSIPLGQQIGVQKEAQSAFGYLTRFVFGALSRTGTMVSSSGGRVIKFTDPDVHAKEIRAKIMSDPEFAEKMFLAIRDKVSSGLTKEEKKALIQAGVNVTILETKKAGERLKDDYNAPVGLK